MDTEVVVRALRPYYPEEGPAALWSQTDTAIRNLCTQYPAAYVVDYIISMLQRGDESDLIYYTQELIAGDPTQFTADLERYIEDAFENARIQKEW